MENARVEVSGGELLSPFERVALRSSPIDRLPLEKLTWENFERLIARLAVAEAQRSGSEFSIVPVQGFRYGRPGQAQGGIDIVVQAPASSGIRWLVYQAKRMSAVNGSDVEQAVSLFLKNEHASYADAFTLCVSYPVQEDAKCLDRWRVCADRIVERGIAPALWDERALQGLLRGHFDIVRALYSDDVARAFCTPSLDSVHYPPDAPFEAEHVTCSDTFLTIRNRTVGLSVALPHATSSGVDHVSFYMSAVISLARHDLKGVLLHLSSAELVEWIEWRRHSAADTQGCPYLMNMHGRPGDFLLTSRSATFPLKGHERLDLDWVLRKAGDFVLRAAASVCKAWRVHRFEQMKVESDRVGFAIATVDRWLWLALIAFAREHVAWEGEGPWHIFGDAGSTGSFHVFTRDQTAHLDAGLHVSIDAYHPISRAFPDDRRLTMVWTAPPSWLQTVSPRRYWDAETAHEWFLEKLVPRVLELDHQRRLQSWRGKWWQSSSTRGTRPQMADARSAAYSAAKEMAHETSVPQSSLAQLKRAIDTLQRFFSTEKKLSPVGAHHRRAVLRLALWFVPFVGGLDEYYIRSKLGLDKGESVQDGMSRLLRKTTLSVSSVEMDLTLRALGAVVSGIEDPPPGMVEYAAEQLQETWTLHQEHLLLRHWRSTV